MEGGRQVTPRPRRVPAETGGRPPPRLGDSLPVRRPSTNELDLISIRLLLALEARGSISRAAAALHMAQPSASARLRRFEAIVGTALIDRGSAGSRLTPAGRLISEWAGEVVSALDGMTAAIGSLARDSVNPLRVAASLTIAEHLLPNWLAGLSERMPAADVHSFVGNSAAVCSLVASGEATLGFIESPEAPPTLTARSFATDEVVAVASRAHLWSATGHPVARADLLAAPLIVREQGSGTRAAAESALGELSGRNTLIEVQSSVAARAALAMGRAVALLSILAVREDIRAQRLVQIPAEGLPVVRTLRTVWHGAMPDDLVSRALLEIVHGAGQE